MGEGLSQPRIEETKVRSRSRKRSRSHRSRSRRKDKDKNRRNKGMSRSRSVSARKSPKRKKEPKRENVDRESFEDALKRRMKERESRDTTRMDVVDQGHAQREWR